MKKDNKYWTGRDVIMVEANETPKQNTFGRIVDHLPKYSTCDYVKVKWENGLINKVPIHWISIFSCDNVD